MINPSITTEVKQLLLGKNFASLATLMKDGSPHVAPTWVDYDGDLILINTAAGRIKEKNVNSDKRVALSVYESSNPYNILTPIIFLQRMLDIIFYESILIFVLLRLEV